MEAISDGSPREDCRKVRLLLPSTETFRWFFPIVSIGTARSASRWRDKLTGETEKPLRVTLALITKRGDVGSLDPLWQEFVGRKMFEWQGGQEPVGPEKASLLFPINLTSPSHFQAYLIRGGLWDQALS